jgi:hypothetical protein
MIKEAALRKKDGSIFTGTSHGNILFKNDDVNLIGAEEGFVTDKDEFVDRFRAAEIAFECKQIPKPQNKLFSVDLY